MPRKKMEAPKNMSMCEELTLGSVLEAFPRSQIETVLDKHGRNTERFRLLPAFLTVYQVIMIGFYGEASLREILRVMLEKLLNLFAFAKPQIAQRSSITTARQKVGHEVLKELFEANVRPVATKEHKGCFFKDLRIVAVDGSEIELINSKENSAFFGKRLNQHGEAGYPTMRLVSLIECGTRIMFAAATGGVHDGELALFEKLHEKLEPGMLLLADRYYYSFKLWCKLGRMGVKLLFRMKTGLAMRKLRRLKDGSYVVEIIPPPGAIAEGVCKKGEKILARVIEYETQYRNGEKGELTRLMTNILDENYATAEELARLYAERWNIETGLCEFKTWLKRPKKAFKSQLSDLVVQEFYGCMMAHYVVRKTMAAAALKGDIAPAELSFIHSLRVLKRKFQAFSPSELQDVS
jgi:hypothetical protein